MHRTTSILILLISLTAFVPLQAQPKDTSAVDTIKQLEQEMGNAMVAGDIERLKQIYADDWATVGSSGKVITKETLLTVRQCCCRLRQCQRKEEPGRKRY